MKRLATVLLAVLLCLGLACPAAAAENPFNDVPAAEYYYGPVIWAVNNGVAAGITPAVFAPEDQCTQGQILTFIWRAAGQNIHNIKNPYSSPLVSTAEYYYPALLWAYEKGIVTDSGLDPSAPCTRSDVVNYLYRLAGSPGAADVSFADVAGSAPYYSAVCWAVEKGVTSGTGPDSFSPDRICTRGQIVTFLHNALFLWGSGDGGDNSSSAASGGSITDAQMQQILSDVGVQKGNASIKSMCAALCLCYYARWSEGSVYSPSDMGGLVANWGQVGGKSNSYDSQAQLLSALKAQLDGGYPCIVHTYSNYSQHWLFVYRYSGGGEEMEDFYAADPWDGSLYTLKSYGYSLHADLRMITFS